MLDLPSNMRVYLCSTPIDLRKSFDGLSAAVEAVFQRKRLEAGVFELPAAAADRAQLTLDATALAMLLGGVPLATPRGKRYARSTAAADARQSTPRLCPTNSARVMR